MPKLPIFTPPKRENTARVRDNNRMPPPTSHHPHLLTLNILTHIRRKRKRNQLNLSYSELQSMHYAKYWVEKSCHLIAIDYSSLNSEKLLTYREHWLHFSDFRSSSQNAKWQVFNVKSVLIHTNPFKEFLHINPEGFVCIKTEKYVFSAR